MGRAVHRLPLKPEERHKILWQNAADVFRLKPPTAASKPGRPIRTMEKKNGFMVGSQNFGADVVTGVARGPARCLSTALAAGLAEARCSRSVRSARRPAACLLVASSATARW